MAAHTVILHRHIRHVSDTMYCMLNPAPNAKTSIGFSDPYSHTSRNETNTPCNTRGDLQMVSVCVCVCTSVCMYLCVRDTAVGG